MPRQRATAAAEFRRMIKWIAAIAVLMVIGALSFEHWMGELTLHMGIATVLGVFFATLLGAGLFALAFFSDKSGHDANVTRATRSEDPDR